MPVWKTAMETSLVNNFLDIHKKRSKLKVHSIRSLFTNSVIFFERYSLRIKDSFYENNIPGEIYALSFSVLNKRPDFFVRYILRKFNFSTRTRERNADNFLYES